MRLLVLIVVFSATPALAQVEFRGPISVTSEIKAWAADINARVAGMKAKGTYPRLGYVECAPVAEIPDTVLCAHYDRIEMESAFIRPSLYIEGGDGYEKGSLARLDDIAYLEHIGRNVDGIDLRGEDLAVYFDAREKACAESGRSRAVCQTDYEIQFKSAVVDPLARKSTHYTIITVALNGLKKNPPGSSTLYTWGPAGYLLTAAHEVLHAQYFMQPGFAAAVDQFWNEFVTADDRELVRKTLKSFGYDRNDELLMRNEFMAFTLQPVGEIRALRDFSEPKRDFDAAYRDALFAALDKAGTPPIQVR